MPRTKQWIATVHYSSDLGSLDVDYGVDDLASLHLVIETGPGYGVITYIEVARNPAVQVTITTIEDISGGQKNDVARIGQPGSQSGGPEEVG